MPFGQLFYLSSHARSPPSCLPLTPGMNKQMRSGARRLEGVVLGGDLVVVEVTEEGNLLEDVGLDTGNTVEEEEGEETSHAAEASGKNTAVVELEADAHGDRRSY